MANVKINMMLNDSGNTIQKRTTETKALNSELTKTQKLAQGVSMPGGGGGGRPPMTSGEVVEYGRSRAVGTGTGASARDFANQAQGLGGLVRIYATLAANIFAAGAAFRALSNAMDTTNMVKGLDQLGAASGTALGSLSQRLVLATDGAVSLRTAMEATVKASSAGMDSDQILKMGQVAKQASQALGIDMTDALSRISRGITKLEPELLDELGLFVKIDDATNKYALSVGKSAASLTDFERRQAFANATLDQGIKKFGEIDLQSNSYNRLAAQLANLTQSGLELVNKFLAPVATILADNTGLLIGVLGVLSAKILKMAIPALGQWRAGIVSAAQSAKTAATDINRSFAENIVGKWEARLQIPDLEKSVDLAKGKFKDLAKSIPASLAKSGFAGTLARTDLNDQKQVATLSKSINVTLANRQKELDALKGKRSRDAQAAKAQYTAEIAYLNSIQAELKQTQAEQAKLTTARGKLGDQSETTLGSFSSPGELARERITREANRTAISLDALSRVSSNTLKMGFIDSIKTLNQELPKNLGIVRRWSTLVTGSLVAVGTSAGLMFNAISGALGAIVFAGGLVVGAIKYFSATKRETELTGEAFDRVNGAIKGATLSIERLSKLEDPLKFLSVENTDARATALKELGDSIYLSITRGIAELNKMNFGDEILNWVKKLWGGDVESKMAEGLVDSLNKAFEIAGYSEATETARQAVERIVGAAIGTAQFNVNVSAIVKSEDKTQALELAGILEKIGKESKVSSSKSLELRDSLKQVNTSLQEFQRSQQPTDALYKIATQSTDALVKLDRALKDPVSSLTAILEASKDVNFLTILPPGSADGIIENNKALQDYSLKVAQAQKVVKPLQDNIAKLNQNIYNTTQAIARNEEINNTSAVEGLQKNLQKLKAEIADLKKQELKIKTTIIGPEIEKLRNTFSAIIGPALKAQAELAATRLAQELNKAQTAVGSAIAGLLGGTQAGIRLQGELERKGIDAQIKLIEETRNLSLRIAENSALLTIRNLKDEKQQLEQLDRERNGLTQEQQIRLGALPKEIATAEETLGGVKGLQAGGKRAPKISSDMAVNNPQLYGIVRQMQESGVAIQGAQAQKLVSIIQEAEKESARVLKVEEDQKKARIDSLKLEQQLTDQKLASGLISAETAAAQKKIASDEMAQLEAALRINKENAESAKFLRLKQEIEKNNIGLSETQRNQIIGLLNLDIQRSDQKQTQVAADNRALDVIKQLADAEAKVKAEVQDRMKIITHEQNLQQIAADTTSALRSEELRLLEQSYTQGKLTTDEFNFQKRILEDITAEEEYRQKRQNIFNKYKQKELELELKIALTKKRGLPTGELEAELERLKRERDAEVGGLDRVKAAQDVVRSSTENLTSRQKAYEDIIISGADRMADAWVNFAKTGKMSFKDMINGMLEDLLRYEIRLQYLQAWSNVRKPVLDWIGSLFGPSAAATSSYSSTGGIEEHVFNPLTRAKGAGYLKGGMEYFAKGGMFTNSIVDNPTIFKFAKGVGVMGEAGPEAIMPLKRDSSGNLGVRSDGGGKTEVVVNNYGMEKATAQESVDNRGNRRIEVTIGEMTAGEMSRSGSGTQNALRGTFGLRPQLIRR